MRIRDLNEGFADGFKKGYGGPLAGNAAPEKKAAPSAASSPFSILNPRDAKEILHNILNGKQLDSRQLTQLQKVYNKL